MADSVLIDTSAWIEFFRADGDLRYRVKISQLLDDNEAALCGVIFAELLKGARSEKEFRELEDRLTTLIYLETPEALWKKVGKTASLLLRRGVQIPTTDLLIAILAAENNVPLLQKDRHFSLIERQLGLELLRVAL